jgi:UDP-GlcNAc3NAcA epimerase
LLFAPTQTAVDNLLAEGIRKGVHLVGDVMYEAAVAHGQKAEQESRVLESLGLARKSYSLATVHRAENTDNLSRLSGIIAALLKISKSEPVFWPMHPRTRQRFSTQELDRFIAAGLRIINPAPYLDMLLLEKAANVILTDSGGVQKEAMWFRVPCVTLRDETEWLETVESGWNHVAGSSEETICRAFENARRATRPRVDFPIPQQLASKLIVEQMKLFAVNSAQKRVISG